MFHLPLFRWLGRDAFRVIRGPRARRFLLETLESRLTPVIGAHGLAPEVPRGELDGIVLIEQGAGYGTGALLSDGRHVLTAAHVVDSTKGGKTITFQMARGATEIDITLEVPNGSALLQSSWVVGGPANQGNDLALLTLIDQVEQRADRHLIAPFGAQRFGFYSGGVVGEVVTLVGYGRTGTGAEGNYLDEVQRISVSSQFTTTFTLTFSGQTTAPIASGATRDQVQAALSALSGLGNNVEVSDRGLGSGNWDVRFVRGLGGTDVAELTASVGVYITELFAGGSAEMSRIKREGKNEIDRADGQFLSFDFDDGTTAHNTWGSLGLFGAEAGLERGDSGSPLLVESGGGYSIAGVFSYIATGGDKDYNNFATPDGSFGGTGTYVGTQSHMSGFLLPNLSSDYHLVLDMQQQLLGLDGIHEKLTIHASRDGNDLVLSVYGSSDMRLNGEYYRAPFAGPGGRILSLTLRGTDDDETFVVEKSLPLSSVTIDGRGGEDTLQVENNIHTTWTITGPNAGTATTSAVAFVDIENLLGGLGNDTYEFESDGELSGTIDGGDGYDILDYSDLAEPVSIYAAPLPLGGPGFIFLGPLPLDYSFTGTASGLGGSFVRFEGMRGGAGRDTLVYGGTGGTWWSLTGQDAGNVNGLGFSSFENLTGDRFDDRFVIGSGASVTGAIDGGAGHDLIDFSGYGASVTLNLKSGTLPGVAAFTGFEGLLGGSQSDTIVGGDGPNNWSITGPNEGTVGGLTFLGFEHLTGGAGRDIFQFGKDGFLSGTVAGGGGSDWLDYRDFGRGVSVDLLRRFAPALGGLSGIENVWGYLGGASRLIGDNGNNVLVAFGSGNYVHGAAGRDFLIGGYGRNTLYGGLGDDVTLGGRTSFDGDAVALDAIMAEWSRGTAYQSRVVNLTVGGGRTGGRALRFNQSVFVPPMILGSRILGRPAVVPQTRAFGNGGFDFFVVRYISAASDLDRRRERFV